ncbi:hypothetical protein FLLO111716_05870 [Flavobacterium longum]|uniref:hypothetical protein n=1 Tax=Flavobacterium longum TaxID=1299340 RepID=UPI0039E99EAC
MKKPFLILWAVIFASLAMLFFFIFLGRAGLPYNSEGNYFDENNMVTYQTQSVAAYGVLSLGSLIVVGIISYKYFLPKRPECDKP